MVLLALPTVAVLGESIGSSGTQWVSARWAALFSMAGASRCAGSGRVVRE